MMKAIYHLIRSKGTLFGFLTANTTGTDARNALQEIRRQCGEDIDIENLVDSEDGVDVTVGLAYGADVVRLQQVWSRTFNDFGIEPAFVRKIEC